MKLLETPIRIVLADDHEIFRDGFAGLLKKQTDIILVGQAENGEQLIRVAEKMNPDVILTDIKMPLMDGIEATKLLSEKFPDVKIIALSMFNDDHLVFDMIEAGAKGYLLKNAHKSDIIEAIKAVYDDQMYYCKETSDKLINMMARAKHKGHEEEVAFFSEKEKEIIYMICKELSNKEMSAHLHLSVRTVEGYRNRIQAKMKVKNAAGIVIYSIRHKLFEMNAE